LVKEIGLNPKNIYIYTNTEDKLILEKKGYNVFYQDIIDFDKIDIFFKKMKFSVVIGNPPFGRQSSLAKKFIKKSCDFADIIAFILPRSFSKPSMFSAFDTKFHCILTEELDTNSFIVNDAEYDVPCVFQIWQKKDTDRVETEKISPVGFSYVKDTESYDIVVRRVGVYAGRCYKASQESYSKQSHYFIKLPPKAKTDKIVEAMNKHEFPSNTVGPRSLSKHEINSVMNSIVS
jgi:predicted RNA methylase